MSWSNKLPKATKFEMWNTLVISRFIYQKHLAGSYSQAIASRVKQFYYRAAKNLLNYNAKVSTDKLLVVCSDMPFN